MSNVSELNFLLSNLSGITRSKIAIRRRQAPKNGAVDLPLWGPYEALINMQLRFLTWDLWLSLLYKFYGVIVISKICMYKVCNQ